MAALAANVTHLPSGGIGKIAAPGLAIAATSALEDLYVKNATPL
jgi:hypothetical protein